MGPQASVPVTVKTVQGDDGGDGKVAVVAVSRGS